MRAVAIAIAVAGSGLALAGTQSWGRPLERASGNAVVEVTVDVAARRQTIDGFGTSSRVWTDPHLANAPVVSVPAGAQEQILRTLYRRLGLTRLRPLLERGVRAEPTGPYSFAGKLGDSQIALVKQAQAFGLKTYFPSPFTLETWMRENDPDAYVDWAVAMLQRWRSKGLEPALYAPLNEPAIAGDFSPRWLRDVVVQLGRRLRALGFRTKLVIPDDENPRDAYRRAAAVLGDPAARRYVGAIAYHIYRWDPRDLGEIRRLRQLGKRYGLPVWMTEWNNQSGESWHAALAWAERLHLLLTAGEVNAVDYMWGFFGSWDRGQLVSLEFDDGEYRSLTTTPAYWITGHYSRYVKPGDLRVASSSGSSSVLVSAFRGPRGLTLVATNLGGTSRAARVVVEGAKLTRAVQAVRSSIDERWRQLPAVRPRGGAFTVTLPPRSLTTLVAPIR